MKHAFYTTCRGLGHMIIGIVFALLILVVMLGPTSLAILHINPMFFALYIPHILVAAYFTGKDERPIFNSPKVGGNKIPTA